MNNEAIDQALREPESTIMQNASEMPPYLTAKDIFHLVGTIRKDPTLMEQTCIVRSGVGILLHVLTEEASTLADTKSHFASERAQGVARQLDSMLGLSAAKKVKAVVHEEAPALKPVPAHERSAIFTAPVESEMATT